MKCLMGQKRGVVSLCGLSHLGMPAERGVVEVHKTLKHINTVNGTYSLRTRRQNILESFSIYTNESTAMHLSKLFVTSQS